MLYTPIKEREPYFRITAIDKETKERLATALTHHAPGCKAVAERICCDQLWHVGRERELIFAVEEVREHPTLV